MNIFPIKLAAYEHTTYTSSAHEFKQLFVKTKPVNMSFYAYDVNIHSTTVVEFVIYDMEDSVYGGIGKEKYRYKTTCHPMLTKQPIENKLYATAMKRREVELQKIEADIIESYYQEAKAKYLETIA